MKRCVAALVVVFMVCLAAGFLYAAYDSVMGQIKSIDVAGGKIVIAVRANRDAEPTNVTYLINKDTTVRIAREKKTLADLTVDKNVNVVFKEAEKEGDPGTALLISVFDRPGGGKGKGGKGGGGAGGGN